MGERRSIVAGLSGWLVYATVVFFLLVVGGILLSVLMNSFASSWFGGWLPDGYTGKWYTFAVQEFGLWNVLLVTLIVVLSVTGISLLLGIPAAYALARRSFRGKSLVLGLLILPLLVPPITYGIPLATMLYEYRLAGTIFGVILANLVPALPFVVLVMTPFIEQIDPNLERAARMMGASTFRVFARILLPLAIPGILAAALLVMVRTIAMFELTFLTAGANTQTLVVALYYAAFSAGIRPAQSIDAMAVVYMLTTLTLLLAALRFVNPTNMVMRVRQ
jgi:putative spermidine/putrescine transport system permease protein